MKILQVNDTFTPSSGGVVASLYILSKFLTKKRHEVTIYTSDFKMNQKYIDSLHGVKVNTFHCWSNIASFYFMPGMINAVKRNLKKFNVVHLHSARNFQNIVLHHYARKFKIPYVLQARGSLATFFYKGLLKKIFDVIWGQGILKDATKLIALTEIEAEQYRSMGISEDKIAIVPNGIDLSEFENLPQRGRFRGKHGLDNGQKIVLYLARIHKIKGPDLLVKAFASLPGDFHRAKLVIAGPDDGYLPTLKRLIKELKIEEYVLFTGPLYGTDKLEAYVDADVYVLPSHYEIFGRTLLEACACGTPIIVTDRCGIAKTLNNEAGLVVPYNKEQLHRALSEMLGNDKRRKEFGRKGKLLVNESFNWERIADQIEKLYEDCISAVH